MKDLILTRQKRGYTLIELLTVIAVVAVLAAILFPVFSTAKIHAAAKNIDKHNTRRIAAAILMYADDNDEQFPRTGDGCRDHTTDFQAFAPGEKNQCGGDDWQDAVGPYTKGPAVFLSPGDKSVADTAPWGSSLGTDFNTTDGNLSFMMNDLLSHQVPTTRNAYADVANMAVQSAGLEITRVKTPENCVMLAEGHSGWDKVSTASPHYS